MRFARISVYLALLAALAPPALMARLAPVPFSKLVDESDLIMRARMVEGKLGEFGAGSAVFMIEEVLVGTSRDDRIRLEWSSEIHDQRPRELGGSYLLFLRQSRSGKLEPAIYGRSYWLIRSIYQAGAGEAVEAVEYVYPITMVIVPNELVETIKTLQRVVRLDAIRALLPEVSNGQ